MIVDLTALPTAKRESTTGYWHWAFPFSGARPNQPHPLHPPERSPCRAD